MTGIQWADNVKNGTQWNRIGTSVCQSSVRLLGTHHNPNRCEEEEEEKLNFKKKLDLIQFGVVDTIEGE